MNPPGRDNIVSKMRSGLKSGSYRTMAEERQQPAIRKRPRYCAEWLLSDIIRQLKYYFTFCCLFLAARVSLRGLFFVHKKAPPERGWRVALCAIAWCRVPPGEFSTSTWIRDYPIYLLADCPSAQGDSPCQFLLTNSPQTRQQSTAWIVRHLKKKARKSEPGKISVARCTGFEPVTDCLEGNCSVRLS